MTYFKNENTTYPNSNKRICKLLYIGINLFSVFGSIISYAKCKARINIEESYLIET